MSPTPDELDAILEAGKRQRADRDAKDDPFNQDQARREYKREARRRDDAQNRREREKADRKRRPAHKGPVTKTRARRTSRSRATGQLKKGARALVPPVKAHISSGMQFLGMSLAVAALYLVLTGEEQTGAFSSALGGLQKALRWLSDPGAAIPFASSDHG